MVPKPTSSKKSGPRGAGRPIQFDREAVLDRAVELFWTSGFDGASLDSLVPELGVSRSTLYNSFGGKDGLYEAALGRYLDRVEAVVIDPLVTGTAGIADLVAFVTRVEEVLASPDMPSGCLVLNWIGAPRNATAVDRYLASLRSGIATALQRAANLDEIEPHTISARTSLILAAVIGINHAAQANTAELDLADLAEGLRTTVSRWRRGPSDIAAR